MSSMDPYKALSSAHAHAHSMTEIQQKRAQERALTRAEEKASRAASVGIKLPKKKKKGWANLRERLQAGTLIPALRQIELEHPADYQKQTKSLSVKTFASLAAKITSKSFMMSGAEEKRLMMDTKAEHERSKRVRQERQLRRKLIKKQRRLERELEYLNFPTIMGWYFDGFFTPYFQLKYEWATIFNQMELEISKAKEQQIKETFAEKAKRYFWPPNIIGGLCFRTRGIYLDFEDIYKDPPHTPPDIILDQRMEAVTLFMASEGKEGESKVASEDEFFGTGGNEWLQAEEDKIHQMIKMIENDTTMSEEEKARKKKLLLLELKKKKERALQQQSLAGEMSFKALSRNAYYFDDQIPGFFRKRARDRDKYYYDSSWGVWRIKRDIILFPNDYYWDEQLALFLPKDRTRQPDYYAWDPNLAVYVVATDKHPPNWRGVRPSHFYFDHQTGKWMKRSNAPAGITPYLDQNGHRFAANKDKDCPDDYYFNPSTLQFEKKIPDGKLYFYDPKFGAWRKNGDPYPPKGTIYVRDFYWNERESTFKKKDAPSSFFDWDQNSKIYRKMRSVHGKYHPKNWTWNEKKKQWELKSLLSRHLFMSKSLSWVPDRDYDKPWLEYTGGFRDYHLSYDVDLMSVEDLEAYHGKGGPGSKKPGAAGGGRGRPGGPPGTVTRSEPMIPKKGILNEPTSTAASSTKISSGAGGKGVKIEGTEDTEASKEIDPITFVDTLDRKTLKVTGLGDLLTDVDLRKYFASVKKIIRPKVPGTEYNEDYAYLKFKTEEAAAAALKTMHEQYIKGIQIQLRYKLKTEDETKGGQREVGAEIQGKGKTVKT